MGSEEEPLLHIQISDEESDTPFVVRMNQKTLNQITKGICMIIRL